MGCWSRFKSEFKIAMFGMEDYDGLLLDLDDSFNIGVGILSWEGIIKLATFSLAVGVLTNAFMIQTEPSFYPSFLTPWGVLFCILYLGGSLILTTCYTVGYDPTKKNVMVKLTWLLYATAAIMGCCIFALYWSMVWNPERGLTFNNTMTHGGTLLLVLLQGNFVDRVPLRLKMMLASSVVVVLYDSWLAIHNTIVRYNPLDDDDDDALYDAMKWRKETLKAVVLTIIVMFVGVPFFTLLLWLVSLPKRRYLKTTPKRDDDEETTMMNNRE